MAEIRIKRSTSKPDGAMLKPGELAIAGTRLYFGSYVVGNTPDQDVTPRAVAGIDVENTFTEVNKFDKRPQVKDGSVYKDVMLKGEAGAKLYVKLDTNTPVTYDGTTEQTIQLHTSTITYGDGKSITINPMTNGSFTLNTYDKGQVDAEINKKVAAVVKYLGTVNNEAALGNPGPDSVGDFARAGGNFKLGNVQVHAGDLIVCETISPVSWSVIHGDYKPNAKGQDGYVTGPKDNDTNKVWMTNASGDPAWCTFSPITDISCDVNASSTDASWSWLLGTGNTITLGAVGDTDQTVISNVGDATKVVLSKNTFVRGENGAEIPLSDFGGAIKHVQVNGEELTVTNSTVNIPIPVAADSILGVIKTGYTTSGNNYAVKVSDGNAYVNVPIASGNIPGVIKTDYQANGNNYAVRVSDGNAYTYVSMASITHPGVIELGYETKDQNYAVQISRGNKAFVNVPWENTTYSAANNGGLVLEGTSFSVGTIDCGTWTATTTA